jgi:lipopolysaccharide biosynthesis regulator YciM
MAGSYRHCIDKNFNLYDPEYLSGMIENMGDAYEAIEEMALMIKFLSNSDERKIYEAQEFCYSQIVPSYGGRSFESWKISWDSR